MVPLAEACDFRRVVADQGNIRPAALAEDPAHHVRVGVIDVKTSAELLLGELYAGEAGPWRTYRLYVCDEFAL